MTEENSPIARPLRRVWWVLGLVCVVGCQSLSMPFGKQNSPGLGLAAAGSVNPVVQVSGQEPIGTDGVADASAPPADDDSLSASTKKATRTVTNLLTGRELEDRDRAKEFYVQGDQIFRDASGEPVQSRKKAFAKAAKLFQKSAEAAPGSALAQDSMFMQGESLFFADRLTEATDTFEKLQKEFPRNRHNDQVAARLFSISRYWIETVKADEGSWMPLNLTDASRPRLDADGHAIRVLDQIRYDDPTGRLADDATMAAAAEYIRQQKFEQADEFLTDLRETFSDSEHLFLAHLLGIRCKLEVYAGPSYSGLVLEEAEKLVRQTRQRFPDKLSDPKYGDIVARASAEIDFHRAERLAFRAQLREKQKEYGSAKYYYQQILELHGQTPQAEVARKRLGEIESFPESPTQYLSWLTTIFRESKSSDPLKLRGGEVGGDEATDSGTMLR